MKELLSYQQLFRRARSRILQSPPIDFKFDEYAVYVYGKIPSKKSVGWFLLGHIDDDDLLERITRFSISNGNCAQPY